MTLVISQSMYFPWVGLLEQIRMADVFVHYDDVQYARGFLNRVQIKGRSGRLWLTVPLRGLKRGQTIAQVAIDTQSDWKNHHRKMLQHAYARTPFFEEMMNLFNSVIDHEFQTLAELSRTSMHALAGYFGIDAHCEFIRSDGLADDQSGSRRILEIARHFEASVYLTGHGGRNYLDHQAFERAGIQVQYMNYQIGPYPQLHGEFTPYVSALDLIANCGTDGIRYFQSTGEVPSDKIS